MMHNRPPTAAAVKLNLRRLKVPVPESWYRDEERGLAVCVSREPFDGDGVPRVHISVSCKDRYPTWDELVAVKRAFAENKTMAIYLPPDAEYVNLHENCFHLWETKD